MVYKKNYKRRKNTKNKTRYSRSTRKTYQPSGVAYVPNAAFYAGVGYGKALNGQELLGFNSDDDRKSFERGALRHENYFKPYGEESKPKGLFDRIIAFFKRK